MRLVGFRGRYIDPILAGAKTTTIRPAGSSLPRPGEVVGLRCRYDQPPFAYAQIVSVGPIDPRTLTDRDARADGHDDAADLRAALAETYGRRRLALIRFRLVDKPDDPEGLF